MAEDIDFVRLGWRKNPILAGIAEAESLCDEAFNLVLGEALRRLNGSNKTLAENFQQVLDDVRNLP